MDNIFDNGKWNNIPTEDNVHKELVSALGGDFFAIVDASFLLSLFSAWRNATKDKEKHMRTKFLCAFNLALDRALKRKEIQAKRN